MAPPTALKKTAPRASDALELLRADHRQITDLMDRFAIGQDTMEVAKKVTLVARLRRALDLHSTIEEKLFFPAIRETVEGASLLIDIAEVELASMRRLSDDLATTTLAVDPLYDAKVAVVSKNFRAHVQSVENQLFPKIRKTTLELSVLGEQLAFAPKESSCRDQPCRAAVVKKGRPRECPRYS